MSSKSFPVCRPSPILTATRMLAWLSSFSQIWNRTRNQVFRDREEEQEAAAGEGPVKVEGDL